MRTSRVNRWRGLYLLSSTLAGAAMLGTGGWSAAYANPTGGQVSAGSATISQSSASTVTVTQSSPRAVIDWQSFSIGAGQTTQFIQPNSSAVTLNRVTGNDLSTIAGNLWANGQIILINPAGIVFSQGSQIDTSGLIATTADISNTSFMAGILKFSRPSAKPNATVTNQGNITIANAGLAALVAPAVANSGVIEAKLGKVVLAGAKTFTADLYGDGLVSFDVTSAVTEVATTVNGQPTTALVSNTGQITADGGHILLTAQAVDGLITNLVDAGGTLRARSVGSKTGEVDVTANGQGVVSVTGAIDASGQNPGETGGTVQVLGDRVGLMEGASINASGEAGGGAVLVGGNFRGSGKQQHAKVTYIASTASIKADAVDTGKGGSVAVWSDQQTAFAGSISAHGGANGGDGGAVEVSGKNLDFLGSVDVQAHRGAAGTLMLDPSIVNIDSNTDIPNQDNLLPTILSTDNPGATDHIIAAVLDRTLLSGDVSIAATTAINVNAALTTNGGTGSLSLQAPAINLTQSISVGGSLILTGAVSLQNAPFSSGPGAVSLTAQTGSVTAGVISDAQSVGGNDLTISANTGITLNGVQAHTLSLSSSGTITLNAGTYNVTNGPLNFDSAVVTNGTLTLGGATNFQSIQLGSDTTLDSSAANANITISGVDATTAGAQGLTVKSGTGTIQLSNVGANAMPSFLDAVTTGAGQTQILTNVAADNFNLSGLVVFENFVDMTTGPSGGVVIGNFVGPLNAGVAIDPGTGGLVLNGENIPTFLYSTSGPVTLNSGNYTIGGTARYGAVTLNGALSFGQQTSFGAVTLGSTVTVSSAYALSFTSIDSANLTEASLTFTNGNMPSLTLGPVGATYPLSNLEVDTFTGLIKLGGNINAATLLIFGPAQLTQSITIDAPLGATFLQSLDATTPGGAALTFTVDTGPVSLGTVGGTNPLAGLTALSTTNTVTLGGNVSAGFVNLVGPVTTVEPVTIDTTSNPNNTGAITLGPVFGLTDPVLNAGAGAITLSSVEAPQLVLNTTGVVTLDAGTYSIGLGAPYSFGNVTTNGVLTLGQETSFGVVTLGSATTLDSSAVNGLVTLGHVSGSSSLTVSTGSAGVNFSGLTVGGLTVSTTGTETLNTGTYTIGTGPYAFGNVTTNGTLTLGQPTSFGAVTLASDTTVDSSAVNGLVSLGQVTGSSNLTVTTGRGGATFDGVVASSLTITTTGTVTLDSGDYGIGDGGSFTFGAVTTNGTLSFDQPTSFGAVTIASDTIFDTGNPLSFASIDSLSATLKPNVIFSDGSAQGGISLGPVGATNPLGSLEVDSANEYTTLNGDVRANSLNIQGPTQVSAAITITAPTEVNLQSVLASGTHAALTFSASTGNISLGSVGGGDTGSFVRLTTLSTTGTVQLLGDAFAGTIDLNGAVVVSDPVTISTTSNSSGTGAITLGPLTGHVDPTLDAGAGPITLSGAQVGALSINTTGVVTLNAGIYAIGSGPYTFGSVTTNGVLTLGQPTNFGAVTLGSATTLDSSAVNGALTLGQVSGAANSLTIRTGSGVALLSGVDVGGLDLSGVGQVELQPGNYTIGSGPYAFGDVTTIGAPSVLTFGQSTSFGTLTLASEPTTLDSSAVNGALTLERVIGNHALILDTGSGAISLGGVQVSTLTLNSTGTVTLNAGDYAIGGGPYSFAAVTTHGDLTFFQATSFGTVTLGSATTLDSSAVNGLLTLGPVTGPSSLTVNTGSGGVTFRGLQVAGLTVDTTGTETLDSGIYTIGTGAYTFGPVTTNGTLTLGQATSFGAVTLASDTTFDSSAANGLVTLGPVTGLSNLTVNTGSGGIVFNGIDTFNALYSTTGPVTLNTGDYTVCCALNFGNVTFNGDLSFSQQTSFGAVTLGSAVTVSNTFGLSFASIDSASPTEPQSLTFTNPNMPSLVLGQVGATNRLGRLEVDTISGTTILGGDVSANTVAIGGPTEITQVITVDAPGGAAFGNIDAGSAGGSLTFSADTGPVTLGTVGALTPLVGLTDLSTASTVTLLGGVRAGRVDLQGPVTAVMDEVIIDTTSNPDGMGAITLGPVSGSGSFLTLDAGGGAITLSGVQALALSVNTSGVLTLDSGAYTIGDGSYAFGNVTTNGVLTLGQATSFGAVTLGSVTSLDSSAVNGLVTLGHVSGSASLTVTTGSGGATFSGVDAANLTIATTGTVTLNSGGYTIGDGSYTFGNVTTNGTLTLGQATSFGAVTLGPGTTLDSSAVNGLVTLGQVTGSSNLTVSTGSGGVVFGGLEVAGLTLTTTGTETLDSGAYTIGTGPYAFGNVMTNGTLTLGQVTSFGAVTLGSATTLDSSGVNGLVKLGQVTGSSSLAVTTGSGGATFSGVDAANLTIATTGTVTLNSGDYTIGDGSYTFGNVTTNGTLTFGQATNFGAVTLASATSLDSGFALSLASADSITPTLRPNLVFGDPLMEGVTLGPVGAANELGALQVVSPNGFTTLTGNVSAATVTIGGQTEIANAITIDAPTSVSLQAVYTEAPNAALTFSIGTGPVSLGQVGVAEGYYPLLELTALSPTSTVTLNGDIFAQSVALNGPVTTNGSVTIETISNPNHTGGITLGALTGPLSDLTLTAGNGAITLSGAQVLGLTVTTGGLVTLNGGTYAVSGAPNGYSFGAVTTNGALILGQPTSFGAVTLGSSTTFDSAAANGLVTLGTVTGSPSLTVTTGSGGATFNGVDAAGLTIATTGAVTLESGDYTIGAGPYAFGAVTTSGTLTLGQATSFGAVTLAATTSFDSTSVNGLVTLGPVRGASNLTVTTGSGGATFNGVDASGLTAATTGTVTLDAGDYTIGDGAYAFGAVTTNGALSFGQQTSFGAVTAASDTIFDSGFALAFQSIDAIGPTLKPTVMFTNAEMPSVSLGPVGASNALSELAVTTASAVTTLNGNVNAATVIVDGPTELAQSVTIDAPTRVAFHSIDAGTAGGALTFTSDTGPVSLGEVGGQNALGGLTALSPTSTVTLNGNVYAGTVALDGPVLANASLTIDTTDNANLTGAITLGPIAGAAADVTLDAGAGAITLSGGQLDALAVQTTGVVTLNAGTYTIVGSPTGYTFGAVTTNGALILGQPTGFGAVTLGSATTLDSSAVNGLVTLGTVTGSSSLTVNTGSGGATFAGVTTGSLTVATTGTQTLDAGNYTVGAGPYAFGAVTTNGTLTFGQATSFGAVTLGSDTIIDSAGAGGALSLGSVTGPFGLTLDPGSAALTLNSLSVGAFTYGGNGVTILNAGAYDVAAGGLTVGAVKVGAAVTFGQATSLGAVTLTADTSLDSSAANSGLAFGSVTGSGYGLSANAGTGALTAAGTIDGVASLGLSGGSVTLGGSLGGTTSIGAITVTSLSSVTLSQSANATGNISIATSGSASDLAVNAAIHSDGAVTLTAGGVVSEGANGTITASSLSVSAGGAIQLTGANSVANLGDVTASSLSFNDLVTLTLAGTVNTVGDIAIDPPGGSIIIPAGTTLESQHGNIVLATTETGADIIIDGSVRALGNPAIGGGTVLLSAGDVIDEQGQGVVQASALTGSSGAATNLNGLNEIGLLGGFQAGGSLLINNTLSLAILGSGEAAQLSLPNGASQPGSVKAAGDIVIADAANLSVDNGATLIADNVALGAFNGGGLTIGGAIAPNVDAYLNAAGSLTIAATGSIAATGTIRADAGLDMVTASGGTLIAGQDIWIGYGASDYPAFPTLGYTAVSGVGGTVIDQSALTAGRNIGLSGGAVTVAGGATVAAGTASTGGIAFLNTAGVSTGGAISIYGAVTASTGSEAGSGAVRFDASGNIDEQGVSGTGTIVAASVTGASAGWTNLDGANRVGTLGGFSAGSTLTAAIDAGHPAGLSFTWNDAVPLMIAAAPDPAALAVPPPGLPSNGQPPSPLPTVAVATSVPDITAPGSILVTTQGNSVMIVGNVSLTSNSFIQFAGSAIDQTGGTLTLTAPLSVLDISGAPESQLATLFGSDGTEGISAFATGRGQDLLNRYETLVAASGSLNPVARLRLASLVSPLTGSHVVMAVDQGSIVGTVDAAGIDLVSAGGPISLTGRLGGLSGTNAAPLGLVSFGADHSPYSSVVEINNCLVGSPTCISPTAIITYPNQPQTLATTVMITSMSPFALGSDAQQAQQTIDIVYRAPFDEMLSEHRNSDLDVERLNTGRENVQ